MSDIYYSEQRRWYYRGDRKVPSISRILDVRWPLPPGLDPWYLVRGTMVHRATELIDKGTLDWVTLDPRILQFCMAYAKVPEIWRGIEVVASEKKMCHPSGRFSGRMDRVYRYEGGLYICDIKLGGPNERGWVQDVSYALCYAAVANERFDDLRRMILTLEKDGTPKMTVDPEPERHLGLWWEVLGEYEMATAGEAKHD